jgi:triacylglycerol lipase
MRWGKWVVLAAAFFAAGACAPTVPATPVPPSTAPHPLVIVPGIELFCEVQTTDWAAWEDAAVARGYRRDEVVVFRPDPCTSNVDSAAGLARIVDRLLEATGADKVDIVAHSMGSLASRWCIRFSGVRRQGGPHGGRCGGEPRHHLGEPVPGGGVVAIVRRTRAAVVDDRGR